MPSGPPAEGTPSGATLTSPKADRVAAVKSRHHEPKDRTADRDLTAARRSARRSHAETQRARASHVQRPPVRAAPNPPALQAARRATPPPAHPPRAAAAPSSPRTRARAAADPASAATSIPKSATKQRRVVHDERPVPQRQRAARDQGVRQRDPRPSREVVVTRARLAQGRLAVDGAQADRAGLARESAPSASSASATSGRARDASRRRPTDAHGRSGRRTRAWPGARRPSTARRRPAPPARPRAAAARPSSSSRIRARVRSASSAAMSASSDMPLSVRPRRFGRGRNVPALTVQGMASLEDPVPSPGPPGPFGTMAWLRATVSRLRERRDARAAARIAEATARRHRAAGSSGTGPYAPVARRCAARRLGAHRRRSRTCGPSPPRITPGPTRPAPTRRCGGCSPRSPTATRRRTAQQVAILVQACEATAALIRGETLPVKATKRVGAGRRHGRWSASTGARSAKGRAAARASGTRARSRRRCDDVVQGPPPARRPAAAPQRVGRGDRRGARRRRVRRDRDDEPRRGRRGGQARRDRRHVGGDARARPPARHASTAT